jgi:hypothetical protein
MRVWPMLIVGVLACNNGQTPLTTTATAESTPAAPVAPVGVAAVPTAAAVKDADKAGFAANGKVALVTAMPVATYSEKSSMLSVRIEGRVHPDTKGEPLVAEVKSFTALPGTFTGTCSWARTAENKDLQYSTADCSITVSRIEWHEKPGAPVKEAGIWGTFSGKLAPSSPATTSGATGEFAEPQTITDGRFDGITLTLVQM